MWADPTSNVFSKGRSSSVSSSQWKRDDWWTWDMDSADPLDASATASSSTMRMDDLIMGEELWVSSGRHGMQNKNDFQKTPIGHVAVEIVKTNTKLCYSVTLMNIMPKSSRLL